MLMQADPFGARDAFEASLAIARERKERFEVALTLNALIELDRLEGVEPPQELVDESRAAIANAQDPRAAGHAADRLILKRAGRPAKTGASAVQRKKGGREGRPFLQAPERQALRQRAHGGSRASSTSIETCTQP